MRPDSTKWEESHQERIGDMGSLSSQNSKEDKEIVCKLYVINYLSCMLPCQVIYKFKA